ncbi:MAG: hypothetical protein JWL90_1525 [Chthoniobacteraceae bacterium]|nr:hypothetical protein [Chthoniobacteraceae bacterium]
MRQLFLLIVLGAAGYLGYLAYKGELPTNFQPPWTRVEEPEPVPAPVATPPPTPAEIKAKAVATAIASYKSKIVIPEGAPGEKHLSPPGVFYMVDRFSTETPSGIRAVVPGDQVKLLKRIGNGTLKLTDGEVEFVAKESQVTNDLEVARAAEMKDHSVYRGKL